MSLSSIYTIITKPRKVKIVLQNNSLFYINKLLEKQIEEKVHLILIILLRLLIL